MTMMTIKKLLNISVSFICSTLLLVIASSSLASSTVSAVSNSDNLNVTAEVASSGEMKGAKIVSPTTDSTTKKQFITVRGTCDPYTQVIVSVNLVMAGSDICSASGNYQIRIQLSPGRNEIYVRNYDPLGNTGTVSATVIVTYEVEGYQEPASPPDVPTVPNRVVGCDSYTSGESMYGGIARLVMVCTPSNIVPSKEYEVGIVIWGGFGPYAVSVDWGQPGAGTTLYSFKKAGYHALKFAYQEAGKYVVKLTLRDHTGYEAYSQTALMVDGKKAIPDQVAKMVQTNTSWFYGSVSVYWSFITLITGFWMGYILHTRR